MIAPTPMNGWIDILSNLLPSSNVNTDTHDAARALFARIRLVQRKRNEIVHAVWARQFPGDWGKDRLYAGDRAAGIGFPKKGKETIKFYTFTAAEMRAVANEIRAISDEFREVIFPTAKSTKRK